MKKLRLNLDELKVESFETVLHQNKKGTAFGQGVSQDTDPTTPCDCGGGGGTVGVSCGGSCIATCPNTCAYTCDDATCPGQGVTCYAHCTDPQFTDPTTPCDCP